MNFTCTLIKAKFHLCFILSSLSLLSHAQYTENWYLSKVLNDNNGLPQNSVRSMYFDKETKFLWLTTEAGLVRYDGVSTRVFTADNLPSLNSMRMFTLFSTQKGDVFGSNRLGEVFAIKHNYPINTPGYRINDFWPEFSYKKRSIKNIKDLNFNKNLHREYINPHGLVFNSLWLNDSAWIEIADNFIRFFENKKLLHQWPCKEKTQLHLFAAGGFVYAMKTDASGYCINLHDKKLVNITATTEALFKGKTVLFYDSQNDQPLLLIKRNFYELTFKKTAVSAKLIAALKDLPTDITSAILHSNKRILFISTNTTGVYIYHLPPFQVYKSDGDNTLNNNYASVLTDSGNIFTCRSLLFDLSKGTSRKIPTPLNFTRSMGLDTSNQIWSAMHGNVISFNTKRPAKINRYPVAKDNYLRTIFIGKKGNLWLSTRKFLGYPYKKKLKEYISYVNNHDSSSFYYLTETPAGRLVGVNNKGIYFIDTVLKRLIPVISNSQISEVRDINIDNAGLWWITTYGKGIFVYTHAANKLVKLPVDDKGYLLYSHACIDVGYNNFLVPTNKGLFRLSKNNLLNICANPETPLYYQYFDVSSGLLTNEFNGGCQPAYNRLPNGDIILPALQGLVRVKTKELPAPVKTPVFIDFIETKKNKYKPLDKIYFKEDERVQSWVLSFSQWDQLNNQGIFYRTSEDILWQRLKADERKIQLDELTGGDHFLEIKYQYGLLQDQFSSLKYSFYIAKRYYETIWFWLIVFISLVTITSLLVRFRNIQLRRKNVQLQKIIKQNTLALFDKNTQLEETLMDLNEALNILKENSVFKNRLIGLLGHDMLVPLRFIANISGHLYNDTGKFNWEKAQESSGEIKNTAAELLYLGESLVQWIKLQEGTFKLILQNINIWELVSEIIMVHKPIAAVKNNSIRFSQTPLLNCVYDPVFIKVIVHNLLLNANKFTSGGNITVQAVIEDYYLRINVEDTGIGMQEEIVNTLNNLIPVASQTGTDKETGWGMGYTLIIDLLRFVNGKLYVQSTAGAGTRVSFLLPLSLST